MSLGVLQTGHVNPALVAEYGEYPDMFVRLLGRVDPSIDFTFYPVVDGVFPDAIDDQQAWLITGSKFGVYDPEPWIAPLMTFIRDAYAARIPMLGICFGHQVMAEALGGKVVKSSKGWGVGLHEYRTEARPDWMADAPPAPRLHAMHQDQVITPPPGAQVLMRSEFCEYAALAYDRVAMSMQPHPEFDADFARALVRRRRGDGVPEDLADAALERIGAPHDSPLAAEWMVRFLRQALAHD